MSVLRAPERDDSVDEERLGGAGPEEAALADDVVGMPGSSGADVELAFGSELQLISSSRKVMRFAAHHLDPVLMAAARPGRGSGCSRPPRRGRARTGGGDVHLHPVASPRVDLDSPDAAGAALAQVDRVALDGPDLDLDQVEVDGPTARPGLVDEAVLPGLWAVSV